MSKSTYLRNRLLDHQLGGPPYVRPATVYISLHTADPGLTGASEFGTANNYTRPAVATSLANWPAASGGQKSNGVAIQFQRATVGSSGWGSATHFGLWDSLTGGNFLRGGALTNAPILVQGGDAPYIPIGDLDLTET